jgi:hypothetical protein
MNRTTKLGIAVVIVLAVGGLLALLLSCDTSGYVYDPNDPTFESTLIGLSEDVTNDWGCAVIECYNITTDETGEYEILLEPPMCPTTAIVNCLDPDMEEIWSQVTVNLITGETEATVC